MKDLTTFEHAFITIVAEKVDALGMRQSVFANKVFGDTSGTRIWRKLRSRDEYRALGIQEAYTIAEVLGIPLPTLVFDVLHEAKARGMIKPD
mgnify:CR=1 FL=1